MAPLREQFQNTGNPDRVVGPTQWGVYVASLRGSANQVYATRRQIDSLAWNRNNIEASLSTRRSATDRVTGTNLTFDWAGVVTIDPASGAAQNILDPLPRGLTNVDFFAPFRIAVNAATGRALVNISNVSGPVLGPPPIAGQSQIFLMEPDGRTQRLENDFGYIGVEWIPNGEAFIASRQPGGIGSDIWIIPVDGDDGIEVKNVLAFPIEGGRAFQVPGNPLGSRMAFIFNDGTLDVFDTTDHSVRILGHVPPTYAAIWPAGSKFLSLCPRVDLETGEVSPCDGSPGLDNNAYPSPDGRYVARLGTFELKPNLNPPQNNCNGIPLSLTIEDVKTGGSRTPLACSPGGPGVATWISETKFVLTVYNRWYGEGSLPSRLWLVDAEEGTALSLTEGLEENGFRSLRGGGNVVQGVAIASPDRTKLAIGGDRLRVFSDAGVLLRDFGPSPPGFEFKTVAWDPDGSSFAFLVGPVNWHGPL